jgi:glycosyltransferase involved in cell wall biosynthesis
VTAGRPKPGSGLVAIETHPIQYHAPIYRALQQRFGIPVTAIYGSDFSVAGYFDREFRTSFAWDVDLLSGYDSVFLSRVSGKHGQDPAAPSTKGLSAALRKSAPGAVLLQGYMPAFHQAAIYCALRSGRPILFRAETTDEAAKRGWAKTAMRDWALRWAYGKFARLLYVGQNSFRHYRRLGAPESKLVASRYCVDTSVFQTGEDVRDGQRRSLRAELGVPEGNVVLLFSGKLSERKGPDLLIQAVRTLPESIRERTSVVFLGHGELAAELEELSRRQPAVDTRFAGFQNQKSLSGYYHAADLLVLPSRRGETWGLAVNEALHHGVPAVVSRAVGCWRDLVDTGVTGEICEPDSVESLAQALKRAMNLIGRPEIREQCRRRIAAYTIEAAASGIAEAYREVTK